MNNGLSAICSRTAFRVAKHSILILVGRDSKNRMVHHDVPTKIANVAVGSNVFITREYRILYIYTIAQTPAHLYLFRSVFLRRVKARDHLIIGFVKLILLFGKYFCFIFF